MQQLTPKEIVEQAVAKGWVSMPVLRPLTDYEIDRMKGRKRTRDAMRKQRAKK